MYGDGETVDIQRVSGRRLESVCKMSKDCLEPIYWSQNNNLGLKLAIFALEMAPKLGFNYLILCIQPLGQCRTRESIFFVQFWNLEPLNCLISKNGHFGFENGIFS